MDKKLNIDNKSIRMGNLVKLDNTFLIVKCISPKKLFLGTYDGKFNEWVDLNKIEYILLNSFWFDKIQFKEIVENQRYERTFEYYDLNGDLLVKHIIIEYDIAVGIWKSYEKINNEFNYIKNVFGVHHIQNLMYELLEINL